MWKKYLKKLSLPESYVSITLGFLVVIVAGLLMYNYLTKSKTGDVKTIGEKGKETTMEEIAELPTTYTVKDGDTLWSIAEKHYGSGYNWVTLVKENNLNNPDQIKTGDELKVPKAEVIRAPEDNVSSTAVSQATTYTVVKGDNLWNIAVREYGDGFVWTKIAKANNLTNPNIIHSGNVLKLPR